MGVALHARTLDAPRGIGLPRHVGFVAVSAEWDAAPVPATEVACMPRAGSRILIQRVRSRIVTPDDTSPATHLAWTHHRAIPRPGSDASMESPPSGHGRRRPQIQTHYGPISSMRAFRAPAASRKKPAAPPSARPPHARSQRWTPFTLQASEPGAARLMLFRHTPGIGCNQERLPTARFVGP